MIHRATMYKNVRLITVLAAIIITVFFSSGSVQAVELDKDSIQSRYYTRIVPEVIDGQTIYPTNHATLAVDPLQVYAWGVVQVPAEWVGQGYYFEIWDGRNRVVPGFGSQKIEHELINLSNIDASLHPSIRLVIFQPEDVTDLEYSAPVIFSYSEQRNTRLLVFGLFVVFLVFGLFAGAVRYQIGARELTRQARLLLRGHQQSSGYRQGVVYGLLILLWAGLFGLTLGAFIGGMQIVYLLIKMPVLFLSAFLVTICSNVVLSYMLGVKSSIREMVTHSLSVIAVTALSLAVCSPIILFFIYVPQHHDELLVSVVMLFCIAGLLGAVRFFGWLRQQKGPAFSVVVTLVWVFIYGIVVMQLAWMLRPWVGVVDPVHDTVPFSRMYGGNVFIELINTTKRL